MPHHLSASCLCNRTPRYWCPPMMLTITFLFFLSLSAHFVNAFKLNSIKRTQLRHFSNILTVDDNNNQKWREDVLTILTDIIDPESGLGLVEAGFVNRLEISSDGVVKFDLKIEQQELAKLCREKIAALVWVKSVDYVTDQTKKTNIMSIETPQSVPKGMERVKRVIAVSSCKGGVGKSTVSVSLAYVLKLAGAKVGILDADIYGPSLPTMTKPANTEVVFAANQIQPLEFEGVKLMSMGFINKGAAIMRGPMVNQILNQFVSLCDWGDLDYLIVDMPPGTGDIQLTLAQIMNISAAVIVTTPQRLSFVDVVKGIDLFDTVNVPCVAVVENMANYAAYSFPSSFFDSLAARVAGATAVATALGGDVAAAVPRVVDLLREAVEGQKQPLRVFGEGHSHRLREMWGIENIFSLPLLEEVSACADKGLPYVLANPKSEITSTITKLAKAVATEIARLDRSGEGASSASTMNFDAATNEVVLGDGARLAAKALRTSCRCAVCVEELTGRQLLDVNAVPADVRPLGMAKIGRYAMSVDWSDGHKSLFPFKQVAALVNQHREN